MPSTVGIVASAHVFSPLDLNPALWLDAADTTTITESGGAVSQWANKGSLGNFSQGSGAVQPTTGATTLNGLNVLDFAADYLTSTDAASAYKFLHDGTEWLWEAVIKFGVTANPNAFYSAFGNNGAASTKVGTLVFYDDLSSAPRNDAAIVTITRGVSLSFVTFPVDQNLWLANQFLLTQTIAKPANATASERIAQFVNAGTAVKTNTNTNAPSTANPTHALQIGAAGNNAFPLTGSIAEMVIVSGANATETNRQLLRDYLNAKWAVY